MCPTRCFLALHRKKRPTVDVVGALLVRHLHVRHARRKLHAVNAGVSVFVAGGVCGGRASIACKDIQCQHIIC